MRQFSSLSYFDNIYGKGVLMKLVSSFLAFAIVLFAVFAAGDIGVFVDIPSLLFVVPGTFFTLFAKFGKDLFSKDDVVRAQVGQEGISISFIWGYFSALVGFVIILGNLTDLAAIGPAFAVCLLSIFYSFLLSLIVFYPMTKEVNMKLMFAKASFGFFINLGLFCGLYAYFALNDKLAV